MSTTPLVLLFAASEGHEAEWHLPLPSWSYGAIALAIFVLLLGIAWTFRNTAHTLMTVPDTVDPGNGAPGASGAAHEGTGTTSGGHGSAH